MSKLERKPRILIVDDNPNIHRDFELVFAVEPRNQDLEADETRLFGGPSAGSRDCCVYDLDHALSGADAISKVKQSVAAGQPYQMAFVDIRMPGMDGVETIARIWKLDPAIQIVICTAFADYSQEDLTARLGLTDKLLLLKKPFDTIEVTQLAGTLTAKWQLARQAEMKLEQMELLVARRTEKVLELQRREAQSRHELDEKKLQFLDHFVHEFRTPLTLLVAKLEQLWESGQLKSRDQDALRSNAQRLLHLVDHLVEAPVLVADDAKPVISAADIVVFLRGVIQVFYPLASRQKIALGLQAAEASRRTCFDVDQLEKVVFLILSHALQTTAAGGAINVGANFSPASVEIVFEIFGGLIPPKMANPPDLWLLLARKLVEIQGGTLAWASLAPAAPASARKSGHRFTITLPLEKLSVPPLTAKLKSTETAAETSDGFEEAASGREDLPSLLIIEPDQELRRHIRQSFEAEYRIAEANEGSEALEVARESMPDLIITEVSVPPGNGVELCSQLKSDDLTSHIPCILLASHGDEQQQLKALEAGADEFMAKPFRMSLLKARAGNLLESRRRLRERFGYPAKLVPRDAVTNQMDLQFLQRVTSMIEKNLSDFEFDVDALARKVAVSRRQLFRKIKAVTGGTPNMQIRTVRLNRAAQLLKESRLTVTEITYAVGFSDLKHFREVFREQFGVLPGEYADQVKAPAAPDNTAPDNSSRPNLKS